MNTEDTEDGTYIGPERRSGKDRRQKADRREQIRFELDKEPRRSGKDRRHSSAWDGRNES